MDGIEPRLLSISASDVALLSGFKPNCGDFITVFERYIYQQRDYLFYEDVAHLNMEVVSKKRKIEEIISTLGHEEAKKFNHAMENINVSRMNAKNVAETSKQLAATVKANKQLSSDEKILLNEVISSVKTSYGEYNERFVIDFYEDLTNTKVEDRNAGVYTWQPRESFVIKGKVDGLVTKDDGEKIVVEVKNRVNRIHKTPPFYDQIQLVTYCLMLQTKFGHLIESITSTEEKSLTGSDSTAKSVVDLTVDPESCKNTVKKLESLSIFELDLNTQSFHTKAFEETIIPRLEIFAESMRALLSDDEVRYQWLRGDYCQRIELILYYLPYLDKSYFPDM